MRVFAARERIANVNESMQYEKARRLASRQARPPSVISAAKTNSAP